MKPSPRNLVGVLILVAGLTIHALAVMQIGARITDQSILVQTLFYIVAGFIWLWPARALLGWMGRSKDRGSDNP